jgi:alkylhydroperoxidase family enzyme
MAWIETEGGAAPDDELRALYDRVRDPVSGAVDHIMSVHSRHPAGLAAHFELYRAVMRGTKTLPKAEREMIALVVSGLNGCHY